MPYGLFMNLSLRERKFGLTTDMKQVTESDDRDRER